MGLPFCCARDVSRRLPRVHTRMLLPRFSRGVSSLLQQSSVTQPLRPGAPRAVALCKHQLLCSGQLLAVPAGSAWQRVAPQCVDRAQPCPQPVWVTLSAAAPAPGLCARSPGF